ncbi:TPA: hypothetical protein SBF08_000382 [Campylobacter jejuni]|nr:hypothetical protein [Campylobacter jejuni]
MFFLKYPLQNISQKLNIFQLNIMICRTLVGVVDIGCMNYVNINNMMIFIIYEKTDKMEKCTLYGHERINK